MDLQRSVLELLERIEFLFEKYSNEVRSNTQPYFHAKVTSRIKDYAYDPTDELIRESLLEHVGSTPMVATAFYPYINDSRVDLGTALIMLAIHDIGELVTGDEISFTKKEDREKLEQEAALKLLDSSYHELYKDIESQTSQTAKFAKSIDKILPDIVDYLTPAEITIPRLKHFVGVEPDEIVPLILKHKRPYMLWNPFMTEFHKILLAKTEAKLKEVKN